MKAKYSGHFIVGIRPGNWHDGVRMAPASGMGDDSFYATGGTRIQLTTLSVKKGKTVFIFRIYGVQDVSSQRSMERMLAEDVLARL